MKYKSIYWVISLFSLLFFGVSVFALYITPRKIMELIFVCQDDNESLKLKSWYDEDSCKSYVFLPAFVDFSKLALTSGSFSYKSKDDGVIYDLANCIEEITYEVINNKNGQSTNNYLCFKRLSNIPALFIETRSGSIMKIHNDKNYKEDMVFRIINENSHVLLSSKNGQIKGRGASTWRQPKKSYLITSLDSLDIFGMGLSNKWVLLSNSYDESNLRNKIVLDFAKKLDMKYTPDCEYVDLFVNGNYLGLYLFSEKVGFGENRIDIPDDTKYLFTLTSEAQSSNHTIVFDEASGARVALEYPNAVSRTDYQYLQNLLMQLDYAIVNNANNPILSLDTTSWALVYLMDELFANSDANFLSSYFYCFGDCKKFFRGPVWDYDQSMGNNTHNENPQSYLAKKKNISKNVSTPYYYCLMQNEDFNGVVKEYYRERIQPLAMQLITEELDSCYYHINKSSQSNAQRWHFMYKKIDSFPWRHPSSSVQDIKKYLRARIDFLNSAWIDDIDYHIVLMETFIGGNYKVLSVMDGQYLDDSLVGNRVYKYKDTDSVFHNIPITKDCELVLNNENSPRVSFITNIHGGNKAFAIFFLVFFAFFLLVLYIDFSRMF